MVEATGDLVVTQRPCTRSATWTLGLLLTAAAAAQQPADVARHLAESERDVHSALAKSEAILHTMKRSVLGSIAAEEAALEHELSRFDGGATTSASQARSRVLRDPGAALRELDTRIDEWTRGDVWDLEALDSRELNRALDEARVIAELSGLDVAKLDALYELAKKTIREGSFHLPERLPPDEDETLSRYFVDLFLFAFEREKEIAELRARNQQFRLGLFKRATLAYLRALVASAQEPPECRLTASRLAAARTTVVDGRVVPVFGCPDPVVENLRRYVEALRTIQSADSETLLAHAELVVAEQQLAADVMSLLPAVGDAIDIYSVYMGEDLAGNCLSRFQRGLTGLLIVVPVVGPWLVEQAVKRSPAAAESVQAIAEYLDATFEWMQDMAEGVSGRWGTSTLKMRELYETLNSIEIAVDTGDLDWRHFFPGASQPMSAGELKFRLQSNATIYETLREAAENRRWIGDLPDDLSRRARARSRNTMSANFDALQGRARAIDASNMVPEHIDALEELARKRDEVLIFRAVNPDAKRRIAENYATKGMNVKGKSADWGPQAGFIPVDQELSKLGNPTTRASASLGELEKLDADLATFHKKVKQCLEASPPCAHAVDLKVKVKREVDGRLSEETLDVVVLPDPGGGPALPAQRDSRGRFFDESGAPISVSLEQARNAKPMQVLADENGNPLTADYDFLAFGHRGRHRSPDWDPTDGFIEGRGRDSMAAVNRTVKEAGYDGGNIAHHGAESWFSGSPGALAQDPVVTVIDPQRGVLTVPRCDRQCMQKWCDSTRSCGGLTVCDAETPMPPCIPIDPDRLLKDYFHQKRLDGYNLDPNAVWNQPSPGSVPENATAAELRGQFRTSSGASRPSRSLWGSYNVLGGWTVRAFLEEGLELQYRHAARELGLDRLRDLARGARRSIITGVKAGAEYAFECASDEEPGEAEAGAP